MPSANELYRLTFPNGKSYIGATTIGAETRLAHHRIQARRRAPRFPVHCALKKYGPAVVLDVLGSFETREQAFAAEIEAIEKHGTRCPDGYNMTDGGDGVTCDVPAEARARAAEKMRGRPLSPEHRARLSDAHRGKVLSPEHRAKMSESAKKRGALNKKPVEIDGTSYPSITEAAQALGISRWSAARRAL